MRCVSLVAVLVLIPAGAIAETDVDYEDFHVEFTASYWLLSTTGNIQSGSTSVGLEPDLGIRRNASHFLGKLVLKPARKHRLFFEMVPYRLGGSNVLSRTIEFGGETYNVQEAITSRAEINYLFGGYQYDVVRRRNGHFGILAGVGYMDANGTITGATAGTASEKIQVPVPLAGAEFRVFPLRASNRLNFNGEFKGMSFGRFGNYFQAAFNVGVSFGRHVTVQAGYAFQPLDLHEEDRTRRVNPQFRGPLVSLQFRD